MRERDLGSGLCLNLGQVFEGLLDQYKKLDVANGLAFRDGALYVAAINRILRYDAIESSLEKVPAPKVVRDDLPRDRHHGWKYLAFGPDGLLWIGLVISIIVAIALVGASM